VLDESQLQGSFALELNAIVAHEKIAEVIRRIPRGFHKRSDPLAYSTVTLRVASASVAHVNRAGCDPSEMVSTLAQSCPFPLGSPNVEGPATARGAHNVVVGAVPLIPPLREDEELDHRPHHMPPR
jgi:hypothetical protein